MENKTILVTGSTSGIGLGIASRFAKSGACLIINGFGTKEVIQKITDDLIKLGAKDVLFDRADLAKPEEIELMFKNIVQKYQKLDILVNNAGIQFVSPVEDFPPEKFEMIMRINLMAAFYTIKYAVPIMKEQKWGRIINIASAHGLVASPFKSAYVASKHGIIGLTKSVALEVAGHGITVNSICPGYVKTPLVLGQVADTARARSMPEEDVIKNVILAAQATKKFVEIEEIAEFVHFLASDSAASITGSGLSIDGGWTAQ